MNKKSLKILSALIGLGTLVFPTYVNAVKKGVSKNHATSTSPQVKNNLKRKSTDDVNLKLCKSTKKLKITNKTNGYGIYNRNNNCYMNALLQLLYNINDFRNWILNFKSSSKNSNAQEINAMHHLFNHISGEKRLDLKILTGYLKILGHENSEEDPQEYIQLKWSKILNLFIDKKFKNVNQNSNYIFTNPLCISDVNKNLPNLIPHTVGNQFVLLLKRTLFDGDLKKDTSPLNNVKENLLSPDGKHKYKITGAIVHSGKNIFDGHYYFYGYNNLENKWYVYNDSFVNQVTESEVFDRIKRQSVAILYTDVSELIVG